MENLVGKTNLINQNHDLERQLAAAHHRIEQLRSTVKSLEASLGGATSSDSGSTGEYGTKGGAGTGGSSAGGSSSSAGNSAMRTTITGRNTRDSESISSGGDSSGSMLPASTPSIGATASGGSGNSSNTGHGTNSSSSSDDQRSQGSNENASAAGGAASRSAPATSRGRGGSSDGGSTGSNGSGMHMGSTSSDEQRMHMGSSNGAVHAGEGGVAARRRPSPRPDRSPLSDGVSSGGSGPLSGFERYQPGGDNTPPSGPADGSSVDSSISAAIPPSAPHQHTQRHHHGLSAVAGGVASSASYSVAGMSVGRRDAGGASDRSSTHSGTSSSKAGAKRRRSAEAGAHEHAPAPQQLHSHAHAHAHQHGQHQHGTSGSVTSAFGVSTGGGAVSAPAVAISQGVIIREYYLADGRKVLYDTETRAVYAKGQRLAEGELANLAEIGLLPAELLEVAHASRHGSTSGSSTAASRHSRHASGGPGRGSGHSHEKKAAASATTSAAAAAAASAAAVEHAHHVQHQHQQQQQQQQAHAAAAAVRAGGPSNYPSESSSDSLTGRAHAGGIAPNGAAGHSHLHHHLQQQLLQSRVPHHGEPGGGHLYAHATGYHQQQSQQQQQQQQPQEPLPAPLHHHNHYPHHHHHHAGHHYGQSSAGSGSAGEVGPSGYGGHHRLHYASGQPEDNGAASGLAGGYTSSSRPLGGGLLADSLQKMVLSRADTAMSAMSASSALTRASDIAEDAVTVARAIEMMAAAAPQLQHTSSSNDGIAAAASRPIGHGAGGYDGDVLTVARSTASSRHGEGLRPSASMAEAAVALSARWLEPSGGSARRSARARAGARRSRALEEIDEEMGDGGSSLSGQGLGGDRLGAIHAAIEGAASSGRGRRAAAVATTGASATAPARSLGRRGSSASIDREQYHDDGGWDSEEDNDAYDGDGADEGGRRVRARSSATQVVSSSGGTSPYYHPPGPGAGKGVLVNEAGVRTRGKMQPWEQSLVTSFIEKVTAGHLAIAKGDLARELQAFVNPQRPKLFFEKLISRKRLNEELAPFLGARKARPRTYGPGSGLGGDEDDGAEMQPPSAHGGRTRSGSSSAIGGALPSEGAPNSATSSATSGGGHAGFGKHIAPVPPHVDYSALSRSLAVGGAPAAAVSGGLAAYPALHGHQLAPLIIPGAAGQHGGGAVLYAAPAGLGPGLRLPALHGVMPHGMGLQPAPGAGGDAASARAEGPVYQPLPMQGHRPMGITAHKLGLSFPPPADGMSFVVGGAGGGAPSAGVPVTLPMSMFPGAPMAGAGGAPLGAPKLPMTFGPPFVAGGVQVPGALGHGPAASASASAPNAQPGASGKTANGTKSFR